MTAGLLDLERRPAMVLDVEGLVVRGNRAMRYLLEADAPTSQLKFVDALVVPESRERFAQAWDRALAGERTTVSAAILLTPFHFEPVFELSPVSREGQVRSVLVVMVDSVDAGPLSPLAPAAGALYEVSLDRAGQPERLLRLVPAAPLRRVEPRAPCYRALHGGAVPCENCPVRSLEERGARTVLRLESSNPFRVQLLSARRVRADVASISSVPIDESTYGGLVRERVEALSEERNLTERERSVFRSLLAGKALADVAATEGVSVAAADHLKRKLFRKLRAGSLVDLFRLVS